MRIVVNRNQTTHRQGGNYSNLAMTSARPAQEQFRRTCADSLLYFSGVINTNESTGCTQVCDDCASTTRPGCATFVGDPSKLHLSSILILNTLIHTHTHTHTHIANDPQNQSSKTWCTIWQQLLPSLGLKRGISAHLPHPPKISQRTLWVSKCHNLLPSHGPGEPS